ncbi:GNAT family N-acetyltransferase [Planktothrix sp. FACHB-1365]|uniref:GNAT family N-acetyltransferase n=1 Tax=Planktothrix sp. FACHB-1365 TaxID=2692855 RepID=UPI00168705B6|nr:GNAT family N-acetyltransferase [Planktothrix sp. FACHB-1365]MBD2482899.1 GNAT family N-acetyltransferase [Planktothrix sp. FACHB-1365]
MNIQYQSFLIRDWQPQDRETAASLIASVLTEYGLGCEPCGADIDVYQVEDYYQQKGGEFWVIEENHQLVGTAGFYPIPRGNKAVEIRKMYLLPEVRGKGLGKFLLLELEREIKAKGFQEIWIETATVLKEAVQLYERYGYEPTTGVETKRCDLVYKKVINS